MQVTQNYKEVARNAATICAGCLLMMSGPILNAFGWIGG